MANWSDTELAAYATTVKAAAGQCELLQHTAYEGDELLALARLCALGQQWPSTYSAARRYTRDAKAAHRIDGYGLLLQADMNLHSWREAVDDLQEMHALGPLTAEVETIFVYAVRTMEINAPNYALQAALIRQADLLQCLAICQTGLSRGQAETDAWHTVTMLREQNVRDDDGAARELRQAVAGRSAPLSAGEQIDADAAQRRFESLGKPMPSGTPGPRVRAETQARKSATLYVIFADTSPGLLNQTKSAEDLRTRLNPTPTLFPSSPIAKNQRGSTARMRAASGLRSPNNLASLGHHSSLCRTRAES